MKDVTDTKLALEPYQIIIRPIVTEKAFHNSSARNTYTFEVHKLASKSAVKDAIEALYDVKVVAVTTQNRKGRNAAHVKALVTRELGKSYGHIGQRASSRPLLITADFSRL